MINTAIILDSALSKSTFYVIQYCFPHHLTNHCEWWWVTVWGLQKSTSNPFPGCREYSLWLVKEQIGHAVAGLFLQLPLLSPLVFYLSLLLCCCEWKRTYTVTPPRVIAFPRRPSLPALLSLIWQNCENDSSATVHVQLKLILLSR